MTTSSAALDYGYGTPGTARPSAVMASWMNGEDGFIGGIPEDWVASDGGDGSVTKRAVSSGRRVGRHGHGHAHAHGRRVLA